jgi:hypothetical protein
VVWSLDTSTTPEVFLLINPNCQQRSWSIQLAPLDAGLSFAGDMVAGPGGRRILLTDPAGNLAGLF